MLLGGREQLALLGKILREERGAVGCTGENHCAGNWSCEAGVAGRAGRERTAARSEGSERVDSASWRAASEAFAASAGARSAIAAAI